MFEATFIMAEKQKQDNGHIEWTDTPAEVSRRMGVDIKDGLPSGEADRRLKEYGANRLRKHKERSIWSIAADQFKSLIIALLAVASMVALVYGETLEGLAIIAVIFINAALGFVTEYRAVKSMEALHKMGAAHSRVKRGGAVKTIPAEELVPGDVVLVEGGDVMTADLRLVEASKLQADESALTGESVPVEKHVDAVAAEAPLAERSCMLFKGTAVTRGSGAGIVTATGMDTELGGITRLVQEAEEERTPLEKRLDRLGNRLIWVTLVITVFVAASGIMAGKDWLLMVETGIALAVATIPEGLPIVATIALARGMHRMARRNALVNRLSSVETLGATNLIFTDKTGTLTENRMTVRELRTVQGTTLLDGGAGKTIELGNGFDPLHESPTKAILWVSLLCNNASLEEDGQSSGDPLEVALLRAGEQFGLSRDEMTESFQEVQEEAFDPETRMMATWNRQDDTLWVAVKGAPEAVLDHSEEMLTEEGARPMGTDDREQWEKDNTAMAESGLRVLAIALKKAAGRDEPTYEKLVFAGLIGLADPPREDVKPAIEQCKTAGVRVVMGTGDHAVTARNIAASVGLVDDREAPVISSDELEDRLQQADDAGPEEVQIYARISPKQKLDLIEHYQRRGYIVAMTGDGVNDAPALKKADIGIAMGQRGTEVAREASDTVLQDDAFSSIVAAIEQGRVIFGNIRRFVYYLLSCNVSEVLVVGLASLLSAPLPILPLQILYLNLVTDIFPALALGMGEGEADVMRRPPRDPSESILMRRHWLGITGFSLLITIAVLGAMLYSLSVLQLPQEEAVTISFLTLALAQLWHVFNMRGVRTGFFKNEITRNRYIWGAIVLCLALIALAVWLPGLAYVMQIVPPEPEGWLLVLAASLFPWGLGQLYLSLFPSTTQG